jgi:hypothetical protein
MCCGAEFGGTAFIWAIWPMAAFVLVRTNIGLYA